MTAWRPVVTRRTGVQLTPSVERVSTTSFSVQAGRKRQSCHVTSTPPPRSSSAAISGGDRNGSAPFVRRSEIVTGALRVWPPSVETIAAIPGTGGAQEGGTSTPFGSTTGITPTKWIGKVTGADHDWPPSSERWSDRI